MVTARRYCATYLWNCPPVRSTSLSDGGVGKTSLLRLLYMALRPTRGHLELFGTDVAQAPRADLPALRRRVGIVFQDFRLLQLLLHDNVALPPRLAGRDEEEISRDTTCSAEWAERAGWGATACFPADSSNSWRLRVVITRPRLLIADEPTASARRTCGATDPFVPH